MLPHPFLTSTTYRMNSDASILFPTYLGGLVETQMNTLYNLQIHEMVINNLRKYNIFQTLLLINPLQSIFFVLRGLKLGVLIRRYGF
jgi:hypothetical protein